MAGGGRACSVKWRCDIEDGGSGVLWDVEKEESKEECFSFHYKVMHYGVMSRPGVEIMKHDIVTSYFNYYNYVRICKSYL